MWLMTKYGFYSIVKKEDGYHVRAREPHDLENLRAACGWGEKIPIVSAGGTDYEYRMILHSEADLFLIMQQLGKALDYPNFKDEVGNRPDQNAKLKPYFEIWVTLVRTLGRWSGYAHK